ncbi:MAG: helix-turn-helix domain-containing protein [Armatimonadota bacterium]
MAEREIMDTRECAELLGVSEERVRQLAREEKLPGAKIGGRWRYSRRQVLRWAELFAIPREWIPPKMPCS